MSKSKQYRRPTPKPPAKKSPDRPLGLRPAPAGEPKAAAKPADAKPAEPAEGQVLRQNAPPPVCPYCNVACESNRSDPFFTRYYCPTAGCSFSTKVPRPRVEERLRRDRDNEGFGARD